MKYKLSILLILSLLCQSCSYNGRLFDDKMAYTDAFATKPTYALTAGVVLDTLQNKHLTLSTGYTDLNIDSSEAVYWLQDKMKSHFASVKIIQPGSAEKFDFLIYPEQQYIVDDDSYNYVLTLKLIEPESSKALYNESNSSKGEFESSSLTGLILHSILLLPIAGTPIFYLSSHTKAKQNFVRIRRSVEKVLDESIVNMIRSNKLAHVAKLQNTK